LLLKKLHTFVSHFLKGDKQTLCYIANATGFGFGDKSPTPATPKLNWERGTQIRTVQSHVRLEVIMVVDKNKQKIGSSFKLLREDLSRKASIACVFFGTSGCLRFPYFCYCYPAPCITTMLRELVDF